MSHNLPDFDDLPEVKGMPKGCAWGLFDKDGKKDVFGTLNLLTPEVVKGAYAEAKEGISVSLNWEIGGIKTAAFGRKLLGHKVISLLDGPYAVHGFDDEIEFNTQCSSQWDSLVHFHHQPSATGYNGCKPTVKSLEQNDGDVDREMKIPTLTHLHKRGGIVARGVLIDYVSYAKENGIKWESFSGNAITVEDLETVAKKQGVEFKVGDVLIVRTGVTEALTGMSAEQQTQSMAARKVCGVEGSVKTAKWVWNRHFAAVACDTFAFEQLPPRKADGSPAPVLERVLHEYFLAMFGMSIGELWDLKALSETCKKLGRYSFLLTSVPLNAPGLIASPPNALALF